MIFNVPGSPSPIPTTSTSTPRCNPKTHACDTPDGAGLNAVGIFVALCAGLLFLAWISNSKRQSNG